MENTRTERRGRVDAARNREKLLQAAAHLASQDGDLSLAAVAKDAGVGIGTLYRHFPNREALLAALYRSEVDRLHDGATTLAKELPSFEALKTWLGRYAALMTVKYGFADAMKSAMKSDAQIFSHSRTKLAGALSNLIAAAADAGAVRRDVEPEDLLIAIAANVSASVNSEGGAARSERLLGLIIDGLRFEPKV